MDNLVLRSTLSNTEAEQIRKIFQRKTALLELMPTIKSPMDKQSLDYLYEKVVNDLQQTNQKMREWWNDLSKTHGWDYGDGYSWTVNFHNQEIMITQAETE